MGLSTDSHLLLTGGSDCEVRLWQLGKQVQSLVVSQRVHKAPITAVKFAQNDELAVSSSIDGSIYLWNLKVTKGSKPL